MMHEKINSYENKSNLSCFDYDYLLGDGCTDRKYFNKLMEYQ